MNSDHTKPAVTMPALPIDVIVDILCRLPVKTLLRFRCLSKEFRSIIDSPAFINRHLNNNFLEQRLIVEGEYPELLVLDFDSVDNAFKLEHPFEHWGRVYHFNVIGSCDGLLALSNRHDDSIGLWNISTKKHQILPKCLRNNDGFMYVHHGFGRDAATDDYKLVRIAYFFRTNITEFGVYSLKTNCWRRIDGYPPYRRYCLSGVAAVVEGTLNWLGELVEVEDRRKVIVSFHLTNENFFEVSLPDTIGEIEGYEMKVMVLGGCLCLVYSYLHHPVYDIWVMKEYGSKDSWTKLFSFSYEDLLGIPQLPHITQAFVCSKYGDKIFIFKCCGEVFRCDFEERKVEIVKINKLPSYIPSVTIYVESLVSPNSNN